MNPRGPSDTLSIVLKIIQWIVGGGSLVIAMFLGDKVIVTGGSVTIQPPEVPSSPPVNNSPQGGKSRISATP